MGKKLQILLGATTMFSTLILGTTCVHGDALSSQNIGNTSEVTDTHDVSSENFSLASDTTTMKTSSGLETSSDNSSSSNVASTTQADVSTSAEKVTDSGLVSESDDNNSTDTSVTNNLKSNDDVQSQNYKENFSKDSLSLTTDSAINWYALSESKIVVKGVSGWHKDNFGQYYYLKSDGTKMTSADKHSNGWNYVGNHAYLFDSYGTLITNQESEVKGKYYYLDEDGNYFNKGWRKGLFGEYHYYNKDGSAVTSANRHNDGWNYIGNHAYLFDSYGTLITKQQCEVKGKYYYLDEDGNYFNKGWLKLYDGYHYYNKDGSAITSANRHNNGWNYVGNYAYLFDSDGTLITSNKCEVKGRYYYLDEDGNYVRNRLVNSEFYGADGALVY